jgi:hypothetical protein
MGLFTASQPSKLASIFTNRIWLDRYFFSEFAAVEFIDYRQEELVVTGKSLFFSIVNRIGSADADAHVSSAVQSQFLFQIREAP